MATPKWPCHDGSDVRFYYQEFPGGSWGFLGIPRVCSRALFRGFKVTFNGLEGTVEALVTQCGTLCGVVDIAQGSSWKKTGKILGDLQMQKAYGPRKRLLLLSTRISTSPGIHTEKNKCGARRELDLSKAPCSWGKWDCGLVTIIELAFHR